MTISDPDVVASLGNAIAQRIGEPRYNLWFERNTKFSWNNDLLAVGVPNHFFQEWLQNTFSEAVQEAAESVFGRSMELRFQIDPGLFQAARKEQQAHGISLNVEPPADEAANRNGHAGPVKKGGKRKASARETGDAHSALDVPSVQTTFLEPPPPPIPRASGKSGVRWRHLSDFVVGACNRMAHASALSVVEAPGNEANPLVLHGPVGTGKTHLLEGIYASLRKKHPQMVVRYVTSEDFTNRFLLAMRSGKLGGFRKYFRDCDALLIDDLQFLAKKRATQEEFLHTFDVLVNDGKQLVATCDCHPRLAEEFTPELTDRLVGGAVWGVTPPDQETRLELLRFRVSREEMMVPEDVLVYLSRQLRGNVRELEGAMRSLRHFSRVTAQAIDLELTREALGELFRHSVRRVQLGDVDQAVCQALRLQSGSLQSKKRGWAVSHPRMLAMYLARKHTSAAYSEIGEHFGGRNHSTAVAAEKKVRQWVQDNARLSVGEIQFPVRETLELVERELLR